ncbi:JNK1/MAPK8-associated membrane protein isoform X2 [Belonocnema kinseyi]|uniref:JNK1/MAPK8-associated membrane protein isoform X2 n=1 Tax=Belonocnema kinseyi TaxID=2817044 RepID=UPI00143D0967|nr:JNK1/MAPK8-associated membrane protein isoform X2 [Belonocnema kinseyi]XP_033217833.1 JNK1/MAPK8-associated membrane protein isoform X2 [Belonocnema kinseyi]
MSVLMRCPGIYCGRESFPDGNWSDCGACPRGFRTNSSSACVPCDDIPVLYDWLYLGFIAVFALVLHWFCIDMVAMRRNIPKEVIALHCSAILEIVAASIITLQIMDPVGSFNIRSCRAQKLSDWYTLLHNPTPNYEQTLHCTQEAVYPLPLIPLHHDCLVSPFQRSAFRFQVKPDNEIINPEFGFGREKHNCDFGSLAFARIWCNGSCDSSRTYTSSSDACPGSIASFILHSYSQVYGPSQAAGRMKRT